MLCSPTLVSWKRDQDIGTTGDLDDAARLGQRLNTWLSSQTSAGMPVVIAPGIGFKLITVVSLVTGTMFLMWLGEQITERGIGNGISMLIFAGIVAGLPSAIGGTLELVNTGEMNPAIALILILLIVAVTAFVVFMERGQRRITVNYARRQQGRRVRQPQQVVGEARANAQPTWRMPPVQHIACLKPDVVERLGIAQEAVEQCGGEAHRVEHEDDEDDQGGV